MIHYKNNLQLIGYKESSIKNFIKVAQEYNDFENKNFEEYYQYHGFLIKNNSVPKNRIFEFRKTK